MAGGVGYWWRAVIVVCRRVREGAAGNLGFVGLSEDEDCRGS